jgi:hypothetical protein
MVGPSFSVAFGNKNGKTKKSTINKTTKRTRERGTVKIFPPPKYNSACVTCQKDR